MIDDKRKSWLSGAYLDRITETALALKKSVTHPIVSIVAKEAAEKMNGEYAYLTDLSAADQAFLEEETVRILMSRLRDDRDYELRQKYGREMLQASVGFHMKSADAAYYFDESAFDAAMFIAFGGLPVTDDDRAMMREICLRYVWPRLRQAHENLRQSTFDHLRALNPESISPSAEFAMDSGWATLIQHAATRVESYPATWKAKLVGGKEKLGCLVLHVDCDYSARGCRSEVERLREEVRLRSLATCEVCGSPGRLRLSGFAKTVCDKHVAILGALREDDGKWADPWRWSDRDDELSALRQQLDELGDEIQGSLERLGAAAEVRKGQSNDEYPKESVKLLNDMTPVQQRSKHHVVDLMPQTPVARQIEADIEKNFGQKADLLLEFIGVLEIAAMTAMNVKDEHVDDWLRNEVDKWQGVQPLSDDDREFLRRYLRSLAIDERRRRQRREDGAKSLERFLDEVEGMEAEADQLVGRERELLEAYAGDLADSARGAAVKTEFLDKYVRDEVDLWPGVEDLSDDDRGWLRQWLRRVIDAEYERIRRKQSEQ